MSFPRYLTERERRRILRGLDAAAGGLAVVALVRWREPAEALAGYVVGPEGLPGAGGLALAAVLLLWLLLADAFEAYRGPVRVRPGRATLRLGQAAAVTAVLSTPLLRLLPLADSWGGAAGAGAFLFAALALAAAAGRLLYRVSVGHPGTRRPTVIVGTGEAGRDAARVLKTHGVDAYRLLGFLGAKPDAGDLPAPLLGPADALGRVVAERGVATVVDAAAAGAAAAGAVADGPRGPNPGAGSVERAFARCVERGAEIEPMPLLVERLAGRVPVDHVGEGWRAALPLEHGAGRALGRAAKRAMDLAFTSLGVLVMLPVFPLIAAAIYLESPGPIFYVQERIGRGGERIRLPKFRSMVPDAEREGRPVWAAEDDERITRVGRILRAMHVDEFPQFLNILKGEMSIIGPRPERPEFVEELEREIPHYRARHAMKPGLGGWGLVNQGYGSSREDARLKHEYDLWYLRHQSLWLDLVILARTFIDTLTFRGR